MASQQSNSILTIDCQRVHQNNVDFVIGKIKASLLLNLSTVNHRIIVDYDNNGMPLYNKQIQRKPSPIRVDSIKEYLLKDEYACFPSNILVSVPSALILNEIEDGNNISLNIDLSKVNISSEEAPVYLQIFDGQHRFKGMQEAIKESFNNGDTETLEKLNNFEFVVSFFIDAPIEYQAMIFSTINRTPVKVSQDLVFDLFGLTQKDSPQKTSLAIALQLNGLKYTDSKSAEIAPFYKRIRLLAKKDKGDFSPISQGMFIKSILTLISPNIKLSEEERNYERSYFTNGGSGRTIFRSFYATNKDNLIYLTLLNYFTAVKRVFKDKNGKSWWEPSETPDNPLQRTIGYLALIDLLVKIFPASLENKNISTSFFENHLSRAKNITLLNNNNESLYAYSSVGKTKLSEDLINLVFSE
ncbi:DGQHR domain-containing protein [Hymenobacter sp. BT186]|uniref:DGQHR domain-containing protein n=1 Tax=Hymenobacter telluris TaxID=2816474 RepID=A0A939JD49_9BACT|nr:DGQHR domain-containing protein [Hymenobacter telluris]MBO0360881.1 DGQHR domain-containing protein [Hymenobacter telluris]MBW3376910.1 DGQHR domain-containing protein [Hymenobacter norwichensis]